MRPLHAAIFFFTLLFSAFPPAADAAGKEKGTSFIIYCSPYLPEQTKEVLKKEIQYFAAGGTGASINGRYGMRPGDTLRILDGARRTQIEKTLIMPSDARTPVLQLKAATPLIKAFLEYLKNDVWTGSGRDNPLPQDGKTPNLNVPFIGSEEIQEDGRKIKILLIGSPLYHDDVPGHDMRLGWLSDGYFNQERSVTVFSVAGKKDNLKGVSVHFCNTETSWSTSNIAAHKEMVRRFWAIFIRECGGNLVWYEDDLPQAFVKLDRDFSSLQIEPPRNVNDKTMVIRQSLIEISKQPESKTVRAGQDVQLSVSAAGAGPLKYQWKKDGVPLPSESSSSLLISTASSINSGNYSVAITSNSGSTESLAAALVIEDPKASSQRQAAKTSDKNDRGSHDSLKPQNEGTQPTEVTSVPDFMKNSPEEFSKTLTKPKELPVKDTMRIGLIWNTSDSSNDVDLDLYVRPDPTSQELSFRNTKSAEGIHYKDFSDPKASHGFELVDLRVPVKPESISVWVNVFKGQSEKGFTGELRVLYANCLRVVPVRIPATKGNQGVDGPKREGSPYWSKVQVAQSLTLTSK